MIELRGEFDLEKEKVRLIDLEKKYENLNKKEGIILYFFTALIYFGIFTILLFLQCIFITSNKYILIVEIIFLVLAFIVSITLSIKREQFKSYVIPSKDIYKIKIYETYLNSKKFTLSRFEFENFIFQYVLKNDDLNIIHEMQIPWHCISERYSESISNIIIDLNECHLILPNNYKLNGLDKIIY